MGGKTKWETTGNVEVSKWGLHKISRWKFKRWLKELSESNDDCYFLVPIDWYEELKGNEKS